MSVQRCHVIVIGGGHAGIEAAAAAARMGSFVILLTADVSKIGAMHCNPSVGGLGKGHLVYEVSALGGVMPKLCSETYLQAKMLNTSKGPAVQGLRLQIDKIAYQRAARNIMLNYPNVTVIEAEVTEILSEMQTNNLKRVLGVKTAQGQIILSNTVIITAGTFLNSAIYVGIERCNPIKTLNTSSDKLSLSIEKLIDMKLGRLKTGTPPRILKSSVDFSKLQYQPSHKLDYLFEHDPISSVEKLSCFVTHTTRATHDVILANLHKAGYNPSRKKGMEPRYCPSIETKVSRFLDKESHHVFIEPESLESDEIYPAGLSNSLPFEVQKAFVRTVPGLENAILTQPGFMIEYDFLQPINLKLSLEHKQVEGLFFAGQVNGTTGYEEAAAQGLMAGINAHLVVQGAAPFILSRQESYIGIMIDDLTTLGVDEPYRMFTSRAERRLILRQDNVFARLYPHAHRLGLIDNNLWQKQQQEQQVIDLVFAFIKKNWGNCELFKIFNAVTLDDISKKRALELIYELLSELLFAQNIDELSLSLKSSELMISSSANLTPRILMTLHALVKYDGYLGRELLEIAKAQKYSAAEIPDDFSYQNIPGLSCELLEKLLFYKPKTLAQAQLIPGMTPAAISLLIFRLRERGLS